MVVEIALFFTKIEILFEIKNKLINIFCNLKLYAYFLIQFYILFPEYLLFSCF